MSTRKELTTNPLTTNDDNNSADDSEQEKCYYQGDKSYCYKGKVEDLDLYEFKPDKPGENNEDDLEEGRECVKSNNIFYKSDSAFIVVGKDSENVAIMKVYCVRNPGKLVPGTSAKLDEKQQDVIRNGKVIFDKYYSGEYGYGNEVRAKMGNFVKGYYFGTTENIQKELKEAKAYDNGELKAQEECKAQDEALEEYFKEERGEDKFKKSLSKGHPTTEQIRENEEAMQRKKDELDRLKKMKQRGELRENGLATYYEKEKYLEKMELGVIATYLTKEEEADNERKHKEWLSYETDSKFLKLKKDATNCSEHRKTVAEKLAKNKEALTNAEVEKKKTEMVRAFDSVRGNNPSTVFDKVMNMSLKSSSDIFEMRKYYEVFMQEDLDVVLFKNKNMSFEEIKLALAQKIAEERYGGKEAALKAKEEFNKATEKK
jgi:hypothetical protein